MSDHENLDTYTAAKAVGVALDLLEQNKPLLATRLLEQLHERLLQDDAVHYRSCLAEVGGEYLVMQ